MGAQVEGAESRRSKNNIGMLNQAVQKFVFKFVKLFWVWGHVPLWIRPVLKPVTTICLFLFFTLTCSIYFYFEVNIFTVVY